MTTTKPSVGCLRAADALNAFACDPPPQHWLCSDAGDSYCYPCARQARWKEMDRMGSPPPEQKWYSQSAEDEELVAGIDGGEWYSGDADSPAFCAGCGRLLRFNLTSDGVATESEAFEPETIGPDILDNPRTVYELRALLAAGAWCENRNLRLALVRTARATTKILCNRQHGASRCSR